MMSSLMNTLSTEQLVVLEREAKDFALINGIAFKNRNNLETDSLTLAPITLFPSQFPRKLFETAHSIQPIVNKLLHDVAYNQQFLSQSLEKTIKVDEFTNSLFEIYTRVMKDGLSQNVSLGLFRSDYMMNKIDDKEDNYNLKQVEVNVISVSFAGLAPKVRDLHKHILSKYSDIPNLDHHLPVNHSTKSLALSLIQAWDIYGHTNAVILVMVESNVINICDQRAIEFTLSNIRPDIKIIRKSFADLRNHSKLGDNNQLIICEKLEVAVIYYRTAYAPHDYNGDEDWKLRLMFERSKAIKCPSIQYHLAGTKKIQQILANYSVLEKFLSRKEDLNSLLNVFTGLWGLEFDDYGNSAVDMALNNPQRFVLKPQREGGGYNYFGDDVAVKLNEIKNDRDRESYILMELIRQKHASNYFLLPYQSLEVTNFRPSIISCELGIFGAIIGNESVLYHNSDCGHLIRSKLSGVNETGVMAGYGALDSPFLV